MQCRNRVSFSAAALVFSATAAFAATTISPESIPLPRERPVSISTPVPDVKPDEAAVPVPRDRPGADEIDVAASDEENAPPIPAEKPAPPVASQPDSAATPATPQPREKPAAAVAAETVPVPEARPDDAKPPIPDEKPVSVSPPLPEAKPEAASPVPAGPPIPIEKPILPASGGATADTQGAPSPEDAASEPEKQPVPPALHVPTGPPQGPPMFADDAMSPACAAIEEGRVSGRPLKPKEDLDGGCVVPAVYAISSVGGGRAVTLSPEAELNCAMTDRLDSFVEEVIEPAAREFLETEITGLGIAGSYICRTRNGQPDTKQSEHGTANAVDVARFVLADGRTISVLEDWADEGAAGDFLRAVHGKACGPFTTVIGPDGDEYHQDHFHLDLQKRGADGQTTFCQ